MSLPPRYDALADRLSDGMKEHPAPPASVRKKAAVAIILRPRPSGDEVLLIRRQERPGDRWSGDVAFPGGWTRGDETAEEGASRETLEEVGLSLEQCGARLLGRLPNRPRPPWARWVSFIVTPTLWAIDGDPPLRLAPDEVAEARWVSLADLAARDSRSHFWWWWRPMRRVPIPLLFRMAEVHTSGLRVWGMTLDMVDQLTRTARAASDAFARPPR